MNESSAKVKYLAEYAPCDFEILSTDLVFRLKTDSTIVISTLKLKKTPLAATSQLVLNGIDLKLLEIKLDGQPLGKEHYFKDTQSLTILACPEEFELRIEVEINPQANKALEGLYISDGIFCTQCEAEGFRKITYYLDRPDCLSIFTTTIEADQEKFPILLSNGNLLDSGKSAAGRHWVKWHDPHKKPSYLFALVAGDLEHKSDEFITCSKRKVALELYCKANNIGRIDFAMESIKRSMKWDEENYGREYDLDRFMVVSVDDFNSGAMENKGLNIFNSRLIMADPKTATDDDYQRIEAVVGHEYFHNWSGNRVTCRDWFQLSLKEGFTVFREQQFSGDMGSDSIVRIDSVNFLRNIQFLEDGGPLSHPVRPDSYEEINNFYTPTVYEKGSEVIRMLYNIIGQKHFREGSDLYFDRFDGQAVTCDDFVSCMEEVANIDLSNFKKWYSQSGTPILEVQKTYDKESKVLKLYCKQINKPTADQKSKEPLLLPIKTSLFYNDGKKHSFDNKKDEIFLNLAEKEQVFEVANVRKEPTVSALRGFSAPVHLKFQQSNEDLSFLAQYDDDGFNRWESMQKLVLNYITNSLGSDTSSIADNQPLLKALEANIQASEDQHELAARLLTPPKLSYIISLSKKVDLDALCATLRNYEQEVGLAFKKSLADSLEIVTQKYQAASKVYAYQKPDVGFRAFQRSLTFFLAATGEEEFTKLLLERFKASGNMTEEYHYLAQILHHKQPTTEEALDHFFNKWNHDSLVMNKWFSLQGANLNLEKVEKLLEHNCFDLRNPNKVYSLVGGFIQGNLEQLHRTDGEGYRFASDTILKVDSFNPQVASRLIKGFSNLEKFDTHRQDLLSQMFRKISESNTSKNLGELVHKFDQKLNE